MIWIFRNRLKFYDSLFGFFSDKKQGVQNVEENIVHVIVLNLLMTVLQGKFLKEFVRNTGSLCYIILG